MKKLWYYFLSIYGFTSKIRLRACYKLSPSMPPHTTGVCLGCGVDMYDGTDFCSDDCADFYMEYMQSYGNQ
jgi:hypothetical protein